MLTPYRRPAAQLVVTKAGDAAFWEAYFNLPPGSMFPVPNGWRPDRAFLLPPVEWKLLAWEDPVC